MSESSSFFGMAAGVVNANLVRRDAYKRYKHELDSLYALGEPQPERSAKLQVRLRASGRTHWTVTLPMYALYLSSLVSFNRDFRPRSPGPVVILSTYVLDYT